MFVEREETGSTNDDARRLALDGAPHGSAVLAFRQTAGRGRAGRGFASPRGGLYLSVVLRPRAPPSRWGLLPLAVGAGVASTLRARGFPVELKWPNDLLLAGRKLGGILVESRVDADAFCVAGVGLNVASTPTEVPDATCLMAHGSAPQVRAIAEALRGGILRRVAAVDEGAAVLLAEVRALCATLGRRVVWDEGEGIAVDLDEDGGLVVESDGRRRAVRAGDVRLRAR